VEVLAITASSVGMNQHYNSESQFQIYPNPADEILHLVLPSATAANYAIYDLCGRAVLSGQLQQAEIGLGQLPKGMYILKVVQDGQVMQGRFVKE
jgi:hypothetical protein